MKLFSKEEETDIDDYKNELDKLDEDSLLDKCIKARKTQRNMLIT